MTAIFTASYTTPRDTIGETHMRSALDAPLSLVYSPPDVWATSCKVRQGTVTPPRRLTPGSIPGSPTIIFSITWVPFALSGTAPLLKK